jgi:hypothetical protein
MDRDRSAIETVDVLRDVATRLHNARDNPTRLGLFHQAEPLMEELDVEARTHPACTCILEKLSSLRWHLGALAGLDADHGHPPMQHYVWALGDLDCLVGPFGFAPARR